MKTCRPVFATALTLFCALGATAQEHPLGQHPAVLVQTQAQGIDPNHFIVAPPASVTWVHSHANGEHPAVIVARQASSAGVNANTFLVQPPAMVTLDLGPGGCADHASGASRPEALKLTEPEAGARPPRC